MTNVVSYSIVPAYVPSYLANLTDFPNRAKELLEELLGRLVILNAFTTVGLYLAGPFILTGLSFNVSDETRDLCLKLLYILIPTATFDGLTYFFASIYEARNKFVIGSVTPAVKQLLAIGYLLLTPYDTDIVVFSILWVGGSIVSTLILFVALRRDCLLTTISFSGQHTTFGNIYKEYYPIALGALVYSGVPLIDQTMAVNLEQGSLAILSYAEKLSVFTIAIISPAISNVLLPYFSRCINENNWGELTKTLNYYLLMIFCGSTFLLLLIFAFNEEITSIAFQRGNFSESDKLNVSKAFLYYSFQVPFYLATVMLMRCLSAMKRSHYIIYGTVISLVVNFKLNYILILYLEVYGIAVSTSITFAVSSLYYFCCTRLEIGKARMRHAKPRQGLL